MADGGRPRKARPATKAEPVAAPVRSRKFTRQALLQAAIKLMAEVGVEAVSVSEVARRAGVTRPGAYYHFKNRDELLVAVHEELDRQLVKVVVGTKDIDDVYSLPAEIAAEDEDFIRLRILKMLERGVEGDVLITTRRKVFARNKRMGRLQTGVDSDMAALISSSTLAAALLSVSDGKSQQERLELAKLFGKTYHQLLFYGVLDYEKYRQCPKIPSYSELLKESGRKRKSGT